MEPLQDARRIAGQSADRIAEIARTMRSANPVDNDVQYRSAGDYVIDYWQARIGNDDAMRRLETVRADRRPHDHRPTPAGVLPEPVVGPVVNFVDAARPLVIALGPAEPAVEDMDTAEGHPAHRRRRAVRGEGRARPRQKMIIGEVTGTSQTFGGYVNVSQAADRLRAARTSWT